jgi:hypothetical protein
MASLADVPQWSARAEIARSMALLPVMNSEGRAACAARISSTCRSDPCAAMDCIAYRSGIVAAATYMSRAAHRLAQGRELLDVLSERVGAPKERSGGRQLLADELAKCIRRDRALQIELASEGRSSPARSLMEAVTAGGCPGSRDASEHPDVLIRRLLDESECGSTLRYTASEVDVVFFQANELDTEVVHSLIRSSAGSSANASGSNEVQLADEDFYINAVRPNIATLVADTTAADPETADRIASQPGGLRALRLLAESVPQSDAGDELFEVEIARSIGNISAGARNLALTATEACDEGLVSLLSRWASDDSRYIARGHLQAESYRALSNLGQPLSRSRQHVYGNGILPLQAPGAGRVAHDTSEPWDTDLVFVHGLRGGPLMTWRCGRVDIDALGQAHVADERPAPLVVAHVPKVEREAAAIGGDLPSTLTQDTKQRVVDVWARDWLGADAGNCRLLSIGHDAGVLRGGLGRGRLGPTLASRAADICEALEKAGVGRDGRDIVFITHSYGGLLVKQALSLKPELLTLTRGIVFFGVPHFGSPVAGSWSGQTEFVLSQAVRELFPAATARAALEHLNAAFISAVESQMAAGHRIEVVSFGEGKKLKLEVGARRGQASLLLNLVPRESADPLTGQFWLIHDADHVQLSKPPKKEDFRYRIVAAIARGDRLRQ